MLGPVTQIPENLHRSKILYCLGEDPIEFEAALQACGAPHQLLHAYRSFRVYGDETSLIVLGGIGTGSQEPLLWELLHKKAVDRIILTGTSGGLGGFKGSTEPYFLETASPAYSALHAHPTKGFNANLNPSLPRIKGVSTDAFYGFGPACLNGTYPSDPGLEAAYAAWKDENGLVDMESGYFYWAAPRFSNNSALEFGAIRACANPVTNFDDMADHSHEALANAVVAAWSALQT